MTVRSGRPAPSMPGGQQVRLALDLGQGLGQHPERGDVADGFFHVQILAERRIERGQGQLVDAERAGKGIGPDGIDPGLFAQDHACLGSAQQLVAAEGEHVHAGIHGLLHGGLAACAVGREVDETAAAQVPHDRKVVLPAELRELVGLDLLGEADDLVVARMDLEQQAGVLVDGLLVVLEVGLVRGADLAQLRAAPLHHVGHPEGAADLDQFAARNDDFLAPGDGVQAEQDRGRIVVHGRGGLDAGKAGQDAFDMDMALAAFACRDVVFEVGIAAGCFDHALDGLLRKDGPPEVRMHDHAGGVDDALEARLGTFPQELLRPRPE